jgi:hypothetical protein
VRCAQQPYDSLPVPRADIPAGIILSRDATEWVREEEVRDVALPLYEGRMIGQFDFSQKGWVSGKGRSAVWDPVPWDNKILQPQYLMSAKVYESEVLEWYTANVSGSLGSSAIVADHGRLAQRQEPVSWWLQQSMRVGFMDVTSATNARTMISAAIPGFPCGNKVPVLFLQTGRNHVLSAILNSFVFDYVMRQRLSGLSINYYIAEEAPLPIATREVLASSRLRLCAAALLWPHHVFAVNWLLEDTPPELGSWRQRWSVTRHARLRDRCLLDAAIFAAYGLSVPEAEGVLAGCDWPDPKMHVQNSKGFWRIDKDREPELRHAVLTLEALDDIERRARPSSGDREKSAVDAFGHNDGEGWRIPETLRLADYGLGHGDRAEVHHPVAGRLGPVFHEWQLVQTDEESWRECRVHARNLLGRSSAGGLLRDDEIQAGTSQAQGRSKPSTRSAGKRSQTELL